MTSAVDRPRSLVPDQPTLDLLREREISVLGRMPWSSNITLLVHFDDEAVTKAVYKPRRGERPLWDFPSGLYRREAAAFELSYALRWDVVPPTIVRDGPLGEGSVQLFVDADYEQHYFTIQENASHRDDLMAICVLDLVANNTDRKSGHCLVGRDERIYAIDNGLSFHEEFKLRTVLWDYAGEPIPDHLLVDLRRLRSDGLPPGLAGLLDPPEADACLARIDAVITDAVFPSDPGGRRYPWPLV